MRGFYADPPVNIVIAGRRFAPTLLGVVLVSLGVALTVRLGLWQVDRAGQKRALLAEFTQGEERVETLGPRSADTVPRYQRVEARGRYRAQRQVLLDNMPSERGWPGYRVLTPFELSAGGWVLVDRGWLPLGRSREQLPQVAVEENERTIRGRIAPLPQPGMRLGATPPANDTSWPRVLSYPKHAELAAVLGMDVAANIVLLDLEEPDGFERNWQARLPSGPERHVAYAVQWFAMAAAMIVIFVVVSLKRTSAR